MSNSLPSMEVRVQKYMESHGVSRATAFRHLKTQIESQKEPESQKPVRLKPQNETPPSKVVETRETPVESQGFVRLVPDGRFNGRGIPVDGKGGPMVLVSDGENDFMVSMPEWNARLGFTCPHGKRGWQCKPCINGTEYKVKPRKQTEYDRLMDKHMGKVIPLMKDGVQLTHTLESGRVIPLNTREHLQRGFGAGK
jgi:hypothetical protein